MLRRLFHKYARSWLCSEYAKILGIQARDILFIDLPLTEHQLCGRLWKGETLILPFGEKMCKWCKINMSILPALLALSIETKVISVCELHYNKRFWELTTLSMLVLASLLWHSVPHHPPHPQKTPFKHISIVPQLSFSKWSTTLTFSFTICYIRAFPVLKRNPSVPVHCVLGTACFLSVFSFTNVLKVVRTHLWQSAASPSSTHGYVTSVPTTSLHRSVMKGLLHPKCDRLFLSPHITELSVAFDNTKHPTLFEIPLAFTTGLTSSPLWPLLSLPGSVLSFHFTPHKLPEASHLLCLRRPHIPATPKCFFWLRPLIWAPQTKSLLDFST